jgi:PadR family transcriptional regulator PadR
VLRDGPTYAYEIIRRIFEQSRHTIRWHQGTVYHVLHHLERQGLVTSKWVELSSGRQRRYYRLTTRGQRAWRERRAEWVAFRKAVDSLLRLHS